MDSARQKMLLADDDTSESHSDEIASCDDNFDPRYGGGETIGSGVDFFASAERMLAKELSDPRYRVPTSSKQADYADDLWNKQKKLVQTIFMFNSVWWALRYAMYDPASENCDASIVESFRKNILDNESDDIDSEVDTENAEEPDLTNSDDIDSEQDLLSTPVSLRDVNQKIRLIGVKVPSEAFSRIAWYKTAAQYAEVLPFVINTHMNQSSWSKTDFVDMLVEKYYLSYVHFTKGQVKRLIATLDYLTSTKATPDEKARFAESEGLSWEQCALLKTQLKTYNYSLCAARNRLVECNIKAAISIASRAMQASGGKIDRNDLFNEASIGLIIASERYIPNLGTKFLTFATSWMNQRVGRFAINTTNAVRWPAHVHTQVNFVYSALISMVHSESERGWSLSNIPSKSAVEDYLTDASSSGKKKAKKFDIKHNIWALAVNRLTGQAHCIGGFENIDSFLEDPSGGHEHVTDIGERQMDITMALKEVMSSDLWTEQERRVFLMKTMDDLTVPAIAEMLNIEASLVSSIYDKARKKAAAAIDEINPGIRGMLVDGKKRSQQEDLVLSHLQDLSSLSSNSSGDAKFFLSTTDKKLLDVMLVQRASIEDAVELLQIGKPTKIYASYKSLLRKCLKELKKQGFENYSIDDLSDDDIDDKYEQGVMLYGS